MGSLLLSEPVFHGPGAFLLLFSGLLSHRAGTAVFSYELILYLADISQCFCSSDAGENCSVIQCYWGCVFLLDMAFAILSESLERQKDKYMCLVNHLESEIKASLQYFSARISSSLSKLEQREE